MIICSDVDGVILNYIQGFIDFTRKEKIPYSHNPELYGVISDFPDNLKVRDQFYSDKYLSQLKFYDDSLENLNLLASKHELHLVSALEPEQSKKRVENFGYQPDNPLTIYYKKYIEKDPEDKIKVLSKRKKRRLKH